MTHVQVLRFHDSADAHPGVRDALLQGVKGFYGDEFKIGRYLVTIPHSKTVHISIESEQIMESAWYNDVASLSVDSRAYAPDYSDADAEFVTTMMKVVAQKDDSFQVKIRRWQHNVGRRLLLFAVPFQVAGLPIPVELQRLVAKFLINTNPMVRCANRDWDGQCPNDAAWKARMTWIGSSTSVRTVYYCDACRLKGVDTERGRHDDWSPVT